MRLELSRALMALCCAVGLAACPAEQPQNNENNPPPNNEPACTSSCVSGEFSCLNETTILSCVQNDLGCFEYGDPQRCPGTSECRAGECRSTTEECPEECAPGTFKCNRQGKSLECQNTDDGCTEFVIAGACDGEGESCNNDTGQCEVVDCGEECTEGSTQCEDELIATCRMDPGTGCLAFIAKDCPDGNMCIDGDCMMPVSCESECIEGEKLCGPSGAPRTCVDTNADGCFEYEDQPACSGAQECRNGDCVEGNACQDACQAGVVACAGNQIQECKDTNGDNCVELDIPQDCPNAGETCDSSGGMAVCKAPPMTGKVVINEIFYDPIENDVQNDESPSFIEVLGPPGLNIEGYELKFINGSNGMEYASVAFPTGAQLGGKGFAVALTDKPDGFLSLGLFGVNRYDMIPTSGNSDGIQNGPDSITLVDPQGMVVDAVGYGTPSNMANFAGEGMPAEDVVSGRSLGRINNGQDTDDNAADFVSFFPTPGQANSDLIINEVYVDQPGADGVAGQIETYVELVAPIAGWVDINVRGYVLRAINGNNDMDYIFTDQLGGVDLAFLDNPMDPNDNIVIGKEGYFIVCNIDAAPSVDCDAPYMGPDFQNGPDSFVLEYNGRVIDAISYGNFTNQTVRGEGTPAPLSSSNSGKSLNRWPISDPSKVSDTNDNATDFHLASPSPGNANNLPAP